MKTEEFRKWLKDNGVAFEEVCDVIEINDVGRVLTTRNTMKTFDATYLSCSLKRISILKKIIEYAETPVSERGEV